MLEQMYYINVFTVWTMKPKNMTIEIKVWFGVTI